MARSLNARAGALALAIGAALNLGLRLAGPMLAPLNYLGWLVAAFGVWCFCDEMGLARPLNRAGMVLFAAAFCANTVALLTVDPAAAARADRLYAFTALGALLLWSVAMMHRRSATRAAGMVGASVGVGAIVLLVVAHVLVGTATIFGFSELFSPEATAVPTSALATVDGLLAAWSLAAAALMWSGRLRPDPATSPDTLRTA